MIIELNYAITKLSRTCSVPFRPTDIPNGRDPTWVLSRRRSANGISRRNNCGPANQWSVCKRAPTKVPPRPVRAWAPPVKFCSESKFYRIFGAAIFFSFPSPRPHITPLFPPFSSFSVVALFHSLLSFRAKIAYFCMYINAYMHMYMYIHIYTCICQYFTLL